MPSYTYFCETHGEFEEFHSIKTQLEECPKCKEEGSPPKPPTRLISSGGAFILANGGVGWYKEGYSK